MEKSEILHFLKGNDWESLRERALQTTLERKGRHVFARGLIEFSNICRRNCLYCGLRRQNSKVSRYRLGMDEIMAAAEAAACRGVDTIVLQAGEGAAEPAWLAEIIVEISQKLKLAVTLSLGECSEAHYKLWRDAGAKRYLLRHETSDPALYARLHPGFDLQDRLKCLRLLADLGYEAGGGFMVGLPGQSIESIADDIILCRELGLAMCGVGPFIAQHNTPLAQCANGSPRLALRAVALLRLALPDANLPATTALASLDPELGQTQGLLAGANVLMPSFTPPEKARSYAIYDNKNRVAAADAMRAIESAGRSHCLR